MANELTKESTQANFTQEQCLRFRRMNFLLKNEEVTLKGTIQNKDKQWGVRIDKWGKQLEGRGELELPDIMITIDKTTKTGAIKDITFSLDSQGNFTTYPDDPFKPQRKASRKERLLLDEILKQFCRKIIERNEAKTQKIESHRRITAQKVSLALEEPSELEPSIKVLSLYFKEAVAKIP